MMHKCKYCDKTFPDFWERKAHMEKDHDMTTGESHDEADAELARKMNEGHWYTR